MALTDDEKHARAKAYEEAAEHLEMAVCDSGDEVYKRQLRIVAARLRREALAVFKVRRRSGRKKSAR